MSDFPRQNGNGHGPMPVPAPAHDPGVPILGQPFQVEAFRLLAEMRVVCRCDVADPVHLTVIGDQPAVCSKCQKVYQVLLQWQPGQVPKVGLQVTAAAPEQESELQTTVLEDEPKDPE